MKTDKERELWLLEMAGHQATSGTSMQRDETQGHVSAHGSTQKYATWAAVAAIGLTTATMVSSS